MTVWEGIVVLRKPGIGSSSGRIGLGAPAFGANAEV
jgi:hypothetical protein